MSRIEKLIAELCPEGVEWKELGTLGIRNSGTQITASQMKKISVPNGAIRVFAGGATIADVDETSLPLKDIIKVPSIIVKSRGNIGFSYYEKPFTHKNELWSYSLDTELCCQKYVYYYLLTQIGFLQAEAKAKSVKLPQISTKDTDHLRIPFPPLTIQQEIVAILDTFTSLEAELEAELEARKKQYEFYRDQLLSFDDGEVEWKTLPEMALDFGRGKSKHRPRNDEKLYGGDTPFIQTGDIRSASHIITKYSQTYSETGLKQSKLWPKGTLCITIAANIAETSILGFDACFPDSIIGFVADPSKTSSGYAEYLLQSTKTKLEEKGKEKSSAQSNINLGTFEKLTLPFPSLAEQARIVAILDKLDALVSDISIGLPAEISARRKQYEYYREKLLTFKRKEV